jgi:hypothetical protein
MGIASNEPPAVTAMRAAVGLGPSPSGMPSSASISSRSSNSSSGSGGSSEDKGGVGALTGVGAFLFYAFFLAAAATFVATISYVIYIGPHILGDAAFQFLLAGGLVRHVRRNDASWMESVVKATLTPFVVVLSITLVSCAVTSYYLPDAHTIREVIRAIGF